MIMYCPIADKNIQFFEEDISDYNTVCPYDCSVCVIYVTLHDNSDTV